MSSGTWDRADFYTITDVYINMPKNNLITPNKVSDKMAQFKTLEMKIVFYNTKFLHMQFFIIQEPDIEAATCIFLNHANKSMQEAYASSAYVAYDHRCQ